MGTIDRRSVLTGGLGMAGAGLLAACAGASSGGSSPLVGPASAAVAGAEAKRSGNGRDRTVKLTAAATTVDLGGHVVDTWSFAGQVPGKEIRMSAGDTLVAN